MEGTYGREKQKFNMALPTLDRIHWELRLANFNSYRTLGLVAWLSWFDSLDVIYRELTEDINTLKDKSLKEEVKDLREECIKKVNPVARLKNNIMIPEEQRGSMLNKRSSDLYDSLHKFHQVLIRILDLKGYRMATIDDPKRAVFQR